MFTPAITKTPVARGRLSIDITALPQSSQSCASGAIIIFDERCTACSLHAFNSSSSRQHSSKLRVSHVDSSGRIDQRGLMPGSGRSSATHCLLQLRLTINMPFTPHEYHVKTHEILNPVNDSLLNT